VLTAGLLADSVFGGVKQFEESRHFGREERHANDADEHWEMRSKEKLF
jgi:hypothetical protein